MGKVFVGHDWAETHHDVFVVDSDGRRLGGGRLPEGIEGVRRFHELVGAHCDDPAEVIIATETDRGLFVGALVAAGYTVLAVNPLSGSSEPDLDPAPPAQPVALDAARVLARRARCVRGTGPQRRLGGAGAGPDPRARPRSVYRTRVYYTLVRG